MEKIEALWDYIGSRLEVELSERHAKAAAGTVELCSLPSGIVSLDEALGGFRRSELSGVLSLPGAGARDLAFQSAVGAAADEARVKAFFPGMSKTEATARALCVLTNITFPEAYSVLSFGEGRNFDLRKLLDIEVSPSFPTLLELKRAAENADLVVVDAIRSLATPRGEHPSLFLRRLARSSAAAVIAVDDLRDGFRYRESGVRYKDRLDPKSRYDLAILVDRSMTEDEAGHYSRPYLAETDLIIEDRARHSICLGLCLAFSPAAPRFCEWVPDAGDVKFSKWYPSEPSPWRIWTGECREAGAKALELRQWEREFDQMLLDRYVEELEIAAARERSVAESTDYID